MSIGHGGSARIVLQDETAVIYEYAPYNLNHPEYRNNDCVYDGLIIISKKSLVEPEIHEKLKRMPGGRKKLITKRIRRDVDYSKLRKEGSLIIENSKYCWEFVGEYRNIGMIAMKITFEIFDQYQKDGKLPVKVSIDY